MAEKKIVKKGTKGTSPAEISKRLMAVKEGRLGPRAFINFLKIKGLKIGKD